MSPNSEHLTLPPMVKGPLNGHLTIKVDDVMWCRQPPGEVIVECRWWGMADPVVFRPSDITQCSHESQMSSSLITKEYAVTFDVRTSLSMFENYLKNCENVQFTVVKSKSNEKVGTVTVSELNNLIKERMYQRYFPIINGFGNRIGDLHIGFSLWMKSKLDEKENKFHLDAELDKPIERREKRNKEKALKICKKHSNMLKKAENKISSFSKCLPGSESNKGKRSFSKECKKIELGRAIDLPVAPSNSIKSNLELNDIFSRGVKLRNAMISSLFEDDERFKKQISSQLPSDRAGREPIPPPSPEQTSHEQAEKKAILINFLTGADTTLKEKRIALETLNAVSPAESILFDSLYVEENEPDIDKVEEKVEEENAEEKNEKHSEPSTDLNTNAPRLESSAVDSVPNTCKESQSYSQNSTNGNVSNRSDENLCLQTAFTSVNCCRITVEYLKLELMNFDGNQLRIESVKSGKNIRKCQQPGAVYFVEYDFSDLKQPLNQQYHTPVRYSTKKQNGPVIFFGQKKIHNLRKPFSIERLRSSLQNANWKILRRYLNQRVPSLIGSVFIDNDFEVRLNSKLSFPVESNTGILVGELSINLELGKDKAVFGNFLLGEKILSFPCKSTEQACAGIQTDNFNSLVTTERNHRHSFKSWTPSTSANSRIEVPHRPSNQIVPSREGKCHQLVIELNELSNYSSILKSGKDQACYVDYKFPELDERTNKVHFSNKFFSTDSVSCSGKIQFFFRHNHTLNVASLSRTLLSSAIPGITFSLWTREYHPGIRDHLVATAFLPTAKLCALEHEYDSQKRQSILQESLILPMTATSAILHKDELNHGSRCNIHLNLTYRRIDAWSYDQKSSCSYLAVGSTPCNTEVSGLDNSGEELLDLRKVVEYDDCTSFKKSGNTLQPASSNDTITHIKQIESHKYCMKDSCVCKNYHRLFSKENNRPFNCPVINNESLTLVEKHPIESTIDCKSSEVDVEVRNGPDSNPDIRSILNSQLSEKCQQKLVNFILQGNTKLGIVSKLDKLLGGVPCENGNLDLKSTFESLFTQSNLENLKNCTTVQYVQILESGNVESIDEIDLKSSGGEDLSHLKFHPVLSEKNGNQELVNIIEKELTRNQEEITENRLVERNTPVEFNELEKESYDDDIEFFEAISPPAGFKNPSLSPLLIQEEVLEPPGIVDTSLAPNPSEINEIRPISCSSLHSFRSASLVDRGTSLAREKFFFKPLQCERPFLSSVSDIGIHQTQSETLHNFSSLRKEKKDSYAGPEDEISLPHLSLETQNLKNLQPQLRNEISEFHSQGRAASSEGLKTHSYSESEENLFEIIDFPVENQNHRPNEDNFQEHDVDDVLNKSSNRKNIEKSVERKILDSIDVSSVMKNLVGHLNSTHSNDKEDYENRLSQLKSYVDNVVREIKDQLEVKLQENYKETVNSKHNMSPRKEVLEDMSNDSIDNISHVKANSMGCQNEGYVHHDLISGSLYANDCYPARSDKVKSNVTNINLPRVGIQSSSSVGYVDTSDKRLKSQDYCGNSDIFFKSASSAFSKSSSTGNYKKHKLFRAKVEVERGCHLPKVSHPFSQSGMADNPNTFVKLQTSCHSLNDELYSSTIENSCDPVWMACFDVDIPVELLKQDVGSRLIVQVFEKRERVTQLLGTASISLCVLSSRLPFISGWFNLFDVSGLCKGQIRVNVIPVDNIWDLCFGVTEENETDKYEMKDNSQNHKKIERSSVQLMSSLKLKLSELDFLIDALKTKLNTCDTSDLEMNTVEKLSISGESPQNENFEIDNENSRNFPEKFHLHRDANSNGTRLECLEQPFIRNVSEKHLGEGDKELFDQRQQDFSPFRTYSIHSYEDGDDFSNISDLPSDNSDKERELIGKNLSLQKSH